MAWKKKGCWVEWGIFLDRSNMLSVWRKMGRAVGERRCQSPSPGGERSKMREKATEVIFLRSHGKAIINCSRSYGCWQVKPALVVRVRPLPEQAPRDPGPSHCSDLPATTLMPGEMSSLISNLI